MSLIRSSESMWDATLGGEEKRNEIPHWFGNFAWILVSAVCKLLFRYSVKGREQVRQFQGKSGAIVCPVHTSYLEVGLFYCALRPSQWLRFMAKDSLFNNKLLGQIFSRVGAFPVDRDGADRSAIKRATNILKNKELLGIFPEGTRRGRSDRTPSLHAGAAFIAKMGKAPMIPAAAPGADKVKQKGKIFRPAKIRMRFGKPVEFETFNALDKSIRMEAATWYVMRESFALFYDCAPSEVKMTELFPETQDFTNVLLEAGIYPSDAEIVNQEESCA